MNAPEALERFRIEIDAELKAIVGTRPLPLYDMMRYHLGWIDDKGKQLPNASGKALRPTLCLLACEAVGGDYRRALPAAAAVELVHNYSLIHDDIQDDDVERRHRPTVWSLWGKSQAINAGTAMRVLANLALLRLDTLSVPLPKQQRAQNLIDESCLSLIEGQYLDIAYETRLDVTVNDYLDMIGKKTAALIAGSLELGALLGTDDQRLAASFRDIGRKLGMAFQIKDDILGIWGDALQTGKTAYGDIRRKKKSFPVIYALAKADGTLKADMVRFYQDGTSPEGITAVLRVLEAVEARSNAEKIARAYRDKAAATIEALTLTAPAKRELRELGNFLVERSF